MSQVLYLGVAVAIKTKNSAPTQLFYMSDIPILAPRNRNYRDG